MTMLIISGLIVGSLIVLGFSSYSQFNTISSFEKGTTLVSSQSISNSGGIGEGSLILSDVSIMGNGNHGVITVQTNSSLVSSDDKFMIKIGLPVDVSSYEVVLLSLNSNSYHYSVSKKENNYFIFENDFALDINTTYKIYYSVIRN